MEQVAFASLIAAATGAVAGLFLVNAGESSAWAVLLGVWAGVVVIGVWILDHLGIRVLAPASSRAERARTARIIAVGIVVATALLWVMMKTS